jgi:hypothetical protein
MNNRHRKTSRDSRESISDRDRSSDNDDASAAARLPPPEAKQKHPARSVVPARHLPPDATDEDLDAVLAAKNAIDANDWDADLLGLCRRLRSPMTYIVGLLLNQWQAADAIGVDESMITQLLEEVEAGYLPNNPYHNATHGADVAYTTHVMLVHGVREALGLADYQCAVCVLAAAAHDFRHPGIGANFLIATSDDLAIRYNDKSPLESMHTAEFFRLMKERPEVCSRRYPCCPPAPPSATGRHMFSVDHLLTCVRVCSLCAAQHLLEAGTQGDCGGSQVHHHNDHGNGHGGAL